MGQQGLDSSQAYTKAPFPHCTRLPDSTQTGVAWRRGWTDGLGTSKGLPPTSMQKKV